MALQQKLSEMENIIADRREFYNDSVLMYNTRIKTIPDMFVASMLKYAEKEYFKAADNEKEAVQVKM